MVPRSILFSIILLALLVPALCAEPLACPSGGFPLNDLLTLNGVAGSRVDGCIDGDKLYTNWSYAGDLLPANITVSIGSVSLVNVDEHTVSVTGTGGWTTPFTFGYLITVLDPLKVIDQVDVDITTGGPVRTSSVVKDLQIGETLLHLNATSLSSFGSLTGLSATQIAITVHGTPNSVINNVTDTYYQASIPEPMTLSLIGGGFIALGLLRRRLR